LNDQNPQLEKKLNFPEKHPNEKEEINVWQNPTGKINSTTYLNDANPQLKRIQSILSYS
jgi:hypothetical protein